MNNQKITVLAVDDEAANIDLPKGVRPANCLPKVAISSEPTLKITASPHLHNETHS
ncbi:MAG: hypothetical protein ACI9OD_002905 [Limisphaerales bacterium]|jgi:hypothetical protein